MSGGERVFMLGFILLFVSLVAGMFELGEWYWRVASYMVGLGVVLRGLRPNMRRAETLGTEEQS